MSVSEFANVNRLLDSSRVQTLPSGVAAEFVFGAPGGSVFALGGIDGASLRALLDQFDQQPDDRRALFVRIELAPTAEAIIEHVIELLAETAHRLWPLWFTDTSFAECRSDTLGRAAARVIARQAADNFVGVSRPWAEAAVMLALNGRKPRVQGIAPAIELAQLSFALSRTGLILIMEPAEMDQYSAGLVDALEWIARNAPVAVVALFPKLPAKTRPELVRKIVLAGTGPAGGAGISDVCAILQGAFQKAGAEHKHPKHFLFFSPSAQSQKAADAFLKRLGERQADRDTANRHSVRMSIMGR